MTTAQSGCLLAEEAPPARPEPEALWLWEGSQYSKVAVCSAQHEEANSSCYSDTDMEYGEPDDLHHDAAHLQKLVKELETE